MDVTVCAKVPLGEWKAGSPTHLHEFLSGLSSRASVTAFVPYVADGYANRRIDIRQTNSRFTSPVINMFHFSSMAQAGLLRTRQDIVHWRLDLAQELAMLRIIRGKKVCEVNGPLLEEQAQMRRMSMPVYETARRQLARNLRRFDHVIVVSDELKELLSGWYGVPAGRITVVYNGVNPGLFKAGKYSEEAAAIRQGFGWEDKFVLGFVGGLRPWHGVQHAIRMMSRLKSIRDDVVLCIVGSGHEMNSIKAGLAENGLEDRVKLVGSVPYTDVPKYVEMFDVALAPYPYKGVSNYFNPLKLFEYMAMKKPVICGATSWAKRFLGNDTGVIVDCEDPVTFASAVSGLLDDEAARERMSQNAMSRALSDFTWERNVKTINEVYEEIL